MKNHLNQAISIIIMIHVLLFFKFKDWLMLLNEGCGLKLFFVSREWQTFNKQQDIFRGRTIMSPLCAFDGNYTVLFAQPYVNVCLSSICQSAAVVYDAVIFVSVKPSSLSASWSKHYLLHMIHLGDFGHTCLSPTLSKGHFIEDINRKHRVRAAGGMTFNIGLQLESNHWCCKYTICV